MIFNLSKNAECPCDSGKKYKLCCMGKLIKEHENYYALLRKEGIIKNKLMMLARGNFDDEEMDEYAYEFNKQKFENIESDNEIANFFDWFFLEAVNKKENKRMIEFIRNDYPDFFSKEEIAIIDEWIENTQAGLFEIESIEKDKWKLTLMEIFTGEKYEITDRKASESAIKHDILFARVQRVFSNCYMSGAAMNYPRFNLLEELKSFVMRKFEVERRLKEDLTYKEFMNSCSRMLNEFEPEALKFFTSSGEEVKMCEAVYSVNTNFIEEVLDWFDEQGDFIITDEKYKSRMFQSANIAYITNKNNEGKLTSGKGNILFCDYIDGHGNKFRSEASIDIKDKKIKIFTNSETILNKLGRRLMDNLGDHIKLEKTDVKSMEESLESHDETEKPEKKEDGSLLKLEKNIMEKYYRDWCYQKIPALGNKTPKQAIKTKEGRETLKNLLKDFENHEQHRKREEGKYIPVEKIIREELSFYED